MSSENSKRKLDVIVTVILGIAGIIVLFLVSPDNLLMKPDLKLEIEYDDSLDKAFVINSGWAQAKNVIIAIEGSSELIIEKSNCLEGFTVLSSDDLKTITLELDRMSLDLECSIYFSSSLPVISKLVVTADNSPVSIKTRSSDTLTLSQLPEQLKFTVYVMIAIMIITIIVRYILNLFMI